MFSGLVFSRLFSRRRLIEISLALVVYLFWGAGLALFVVLWIQALLWRRDRRACV